MRGLPGVQSPRARADGLGHSKCKGPEVKPDRGVGLVPRVRVGLPTRETCICMCMCVCVCV